MTKNENITNLYHQLTVVGSKTKAVKAIANACNVGYNSIRSNWLLYDDFPEQHQDTIISILQKMVFEQNQAVKEIETKSEIVK